MRAGGALDTAAAIDAVACACRVALAVIESLMQPSSASPGPAPAIVIDPKLVAARAAAQTYLANKKFKE